MLENNRINFIEFFRRYYLLDEKNLTRTLNVQCKDDILKLKKQIF